MHSIEVRLKDCAGQENCDSEEYDLMQEAAVEITQLRERVRELEKAVLEEIDNRDNRDEWLDALSDEVARYFGVDIGEHSSANNPWNEALEAIPVSTLNKFALEQKIEGVSWFSEKYCDDEHSFFADKAIEQLRKEQEND